MTLQIVRRAAKGESVIELHGRLSGAEVAEFQKVCYPETVPLRIDLKNLVGASAHGILALRQELSRGARLSGASPYLRLLLGGR